MGNGEESKPYQLVTDFFLVQQNFYKTIPSSWGYHYPLVQFPHAGGAWLEPSFTTFLEREWEMQTLHWEQPWAESHSVCSLGEEASCWIPWTSVAFKLKQGMLQPSGKPWGALGRSQVCVILSLNLALCTLSEGPFWSNCLIRASVLGVCLCGSLHYSCSSW